MDAASLAGALVWVALIVVFAAHHKWAARARLWGRERRCVRCGTQLTHEVPDGAASLQTCAPCRVKAQRRYRAGAAFFYGLAVLFAAAGAYITATDILQGGWSGGVAGAALLIGMTLLPAGVGWSIRYFGNKES
jgi:hypothetical protein